MYKFKVDPNTSVQVENTMASALIWSIGGATATVAVLAWLWRVVDWLYWKPRRLDRILRSQGLRGTAYRLFTGDLIEEVRLGEEAIIKPLEKFSHRIVPRVLPFQHRVMNQHGKTSFTWIGTMPRVIIIDPELVKEVLSSKFGHFQKPKLEKISEILLSGLVNYEGEKWAKHRRIINPAFHMEKLKGMLPAFSICCDELIERWEGFVTAKGYCEVDVCPEIEKFTGDVISRTAFGSSYEEGRRVFELQKEQARLFVQSFKYMLIPGYRFLPTQDNLRRKEIYREVRSILKDMIEKRESSTTRMDKFGNDLLGLLMESNSKQFEEQKNSKKLGMTIDEVIEECKLFYFAGQETTSVALTWTMILLSMHPDWQAQARDEVMQVFGKDKPDFNTLNHLKVVSMILYEVLRLYPPVTTLDRQTYKTMELGGLTFPPGVLLNLSILLLHHDKELWGEDASEFNPNRFSEGISKASRNSMAFLTFSWGPRICIGQNFAMLELKMALSTILQHFSFEISPSYIHAPHKIIMVQPQHGAQIILHKL